jgi:hypothetical protein
MNNRKPLVIAMARRMLRDFKETYERINGTSYFLGC